MIEAPRIRIAWGSEAGGGAAIIPGVPLRLPPEQRRSLLGDGDIIVASFRRG